MSSITASEAISPALERTKQILFRPFNFGRWARVALVALFAGEVATQGCNLGFQFPQQRPVPSSLPNIGHIGLLHGIALIVLVAAVSVLAIILMVVFSYIWSRFRFILMDAVLTGECRIREGWDKYRAPGRKLFWFYLFAVMLLDIAVVVFLVLPLIGALRAGVLHRGGDRLAMLLGIGVVSLLVLAVLITGFAIMTVFLKDFVVPVLAFEGAGVGTAWARVKEIAAADPGAFVVYVLMKIVLAIASSIIFGIIFFFAVFLLMVPTIIIGVVLALALKVGTASAGAAFASLTLIKILVLLFFILCFIAAVISLLGFISAPAAIFFESYALYFFGSRYVPLGGAMNIQPSPAPYPLIPPQAPPDYLPPTPGIPPNAGPEPA